MMQNKIRVELNVIGYCKYNDAGLVFENMSFFEKMR